MFRTLLLKEFREQWRTSRFVILVAVLFVSGLLSPVLAKYTPELLRAVPDMPAGWADLIPAPTIADAIGQYTKNVSQFGVLLVLLWAMGAVAQEKERGTAAMLLTRPVRRSAVILAKWLMSVGSIVAGMLLSALGCLLYTWLLFEMLPLMDFVLLNLLMVIFLSVYMTIALLASTLARSQAMAAALAFGGLAVLLVLGSLPRIADFMPGRLLDWGSQLVLQTNSTTGWWAAAISLVLILASLSLACWRFETEEI